MKENELIIGLHKNYKLLFERHYSENEKINHRLRENICKTSDICMSDKGFVSKIYEKLFTTQ